MTFHGPGFIGGLMFRDAAELARRGWLIGHFMPPGDPRHTTGFEVRVQIIEPGENTHELKVDGAVDFNVLMAGVAIALIDGKEFEVEATLADPATWFYTVVQPGVTNAFPRHARTRLVMLCVKSPSAPGLKKVLEE